jgi:hypothetical protein
MISCSSIPGVRVILASLERLETKEPPGDKGTRRRQQEGKKVIATSGACHTVLVVRKGENNSDMVGLVEVRPQVQPYDSLFLENAMQIPFWHWQDLTRKIIVGIRIFSSFQPQ